MNKQLETITNLFKNTEIRNVWDSEREDYYFSVVDVIGALTNNEYQNARNYWKWLKNKLNFEGSELVSNTNQLKIKAKDGKMRQTDVLDTEGIFRLIESVPSHNAAPFKLWFAKLGRQEVDNVFDPSKGIDKMIDIKVVLADWGEIATRELVKKHKLSGLRENKEMAKRGGRIARDTRDNIELELGESVVSNKKLLNYQYVKDIEQIK